MGMTYSPQTASGVDTTRIRYSHHFLTQALAKGITAEQIREALTRPYAVTEVTRYPGQRRYCGRGVAGGPGVAVVLDGETAITLYLDQVSTPLRPDQMNDPAALASTRVAAAR